jgi:hypothetical protein
MNTGVMTFSDEIADFWRKEGVECTKRYVADGYTCWTISVPDTHPKLRNPEYLGLVIKEKFRMAQVLRDRLRAPLYTVKQGGVYADIHGNKGRGTPLARDKKLLRDFVGPDPKVVKLNTHRVSKLLANEGLVYYVVHPGLCETFSKAEARSVLK